MECIRTAIRHIMNTGTHQRIKQSLRTVNPWEIAVVGLMYFLPVHAVFVHGDEVIAEFAEDFSASFAKVC